MRKTKALVALATATTLLLSSMTALADSGTIGGTGELEDYVNKEVFSFTAPTITDVDFTMDPQGLLGIADSSNYTGGTGAVYFANVGQSSTTYSDTSDDIVIVNKSSYDVNVSMEISVSTNDVFTFVDSEAALADATTPSVYLAVECADISSGDAIAVTADGLESEVVTLDAVPEVTSASDPGYMVTATSNGAGGYTYSYALTTAFTSDDSAGDRVVYNLTAACDETADWSGVKEDAKTAEVSIIWSVESAEEEAVEGICILLAETATFWVGPDANDNTATFAAGAVIEDVKVNGAACESGVADNYITITWDQIVAAGQGNVTTWTITCTVDGVDYTATYSL